MTAVNISGTFSKDERPHNGLEQIAEELIADEFGSHWVIGRIKPHGYTKKPGEPMTPTAKFEHIEVVDGDDDDIAWVAKKLDELYAARTGREDMVPDPLPRPTNAGGRPDAWLDEDGVTK